jgi:acetyltransferase-like isoleucine patch superfamily enzyme
MSDDGWMTTSEMLSTFGAVGRGCKVSTRAAFHGSTRNIVLADCARIDDFCVISASSEGTVFIGRYVHLGAGCVIQGGAGVTLNDCVALSSGCRLFSQSDDYTLGSLPGPEVPADLSTCHAAKIVIQRYSIAGANSVFLPGVQVEEGTAIAAFSLVAKNIEAPWQLWGGIPARRLKGRDQVEAHYQWGELMKRIGTPIEGTV